jgi:RNA-directed DNA polymerase
MPIIAKIVSDEVLDTAFAWLCHGRQKYSANNDIRSFRRNWSDEKTRIRQEVQAGQFRFDLLSRIALSNGDEVDLWSSRDALVLKALALVLAENLPVSRRCTHVKGHGGAKYAVRDVRDHLANSHFVFRTDVKFYYASIDHFKLLDQVAAYIKDRRVMHLTGQYLRRT